MKSLFTSATATALILLSACAQQAPQQQAVEPRRTSEKVLYESDHIRYVEVTNWPGDNLAAAVPYPSVLMVDSAWPDVTETPVNAAEAPQESHSDPALPPDNRPYPWCRTQSPTSARTVTVKGDFPQHYYRVEYKRIDGKDYGANAMSWYADVFGPPAKMAPDPGRSLAAGKPMSDGWPFDERYSAVVAAPANHNLRYTDDHIEVLEVAIRDGEVENMHGHPYPSVYADDGGFLPGGAVYRNATLLPNIKPPFGPFSKPPRDAEFPICFSAVPESPHAVKVEKGPPQHFYRIHFKRVDGDAVKTQWQSWYPAPK